MTQVIFKLIQINAEHEIAKDKLRPASEVKTYQTQSGQAKTREEIFDYRDLHFLAALLQIPDKQVKEYYLRTAFSKEFPVTFFDWKRTYPETKDLDLFKWVPALAKGFSS